jgi:tRNA-Thr(GGU) m(6)t(6)A37 methyltransferase TsaA
MAHTLNPIGVIHSCFKEKFGIPRQPGLAEAATAVLELTDAYAAPACVRGLEHSSHIWVLFLFSQHLDKGWTPLVRPPRAGGNQRMGVFATRSTFRPNGIGMSAVKLDNIEIRDDRVLLHLSGIDILDGTPVIDIKPYIPYSDVIPEARNSFAPDHQPLTHQIHFNPAAEATLQQRECADLPRLRKLIQQLLLCDPRPAYRQGGADNHSYGIRLFDLNIRWQVHDETIEVLCIEAVKPEPSAC